MGVRKAVVLGGYGLIGSACMRALADAGFHVTGIGRSESAAMKAAPSADWLIRDIPDLTVEEWRRLLADTDVVVNASGALQDGARDDLVAIHVNAVSRLVEAAAGLSLRIVQISAAGVSKEAPTAFFRTKARGDAIISAHATDWVILRPTLVLSHEAYGGTALLRAAAALPLTAPRILPEAQVQTVYVGDVATAVVATARGEVPSGLIADLTEPDAHAFPALVEAIRHWQGWPAPVFHPVVPAIFMSAMGRGADLLGHLGWRSPLRTTALTALRDGIRGDPGPWDKADGCPCRPLESTLSLLPATRQERLFARAYLVLPIAIATLALFWCLSGLITLFNPAQAVLVLTSRAVPAWLAELAVIGGAIADLFLGLAILWRRWTRPAALGMLCLSAAYLIGSVTFAPDLWADPLGPMVKVFPGMALAAMVWLLMEER
ncbi:SDR family oxidoreductase [Paracoccus alkanivorans]|uniref:NAD-dependent epimerase/dehydratase family protein n=1 Tax=Paracoccus alkanivorans TaxID=2116655 RepID=A0A3M0M7L9_9RHOB|nr:SDR family oxidoreductase [Paracoccus alkanivorans]RMC33716.1 NAD-dependent epimerase/dehydratase family protein [Paracoccus alkanivorans]